MCISHVRPRYGITASVNCATEFFPFVLLPLPSASLSHRSIVDMSTLNVDQARSSFPSLASGFIFGDNAGGSQVAQPVIERFTDYLINTNAQLGADYSVSAESTRRVLVDAPEEARKLFNAQSVKEVVFGPSSTANLENLARGLEKGIKPGDEFIVTGEHEGEFFVAPPATRKSFLECSLSISSQRWSLEVARLPHGRLC